MTTISGSPLTNAAKDNNLPALIQLLKEHQSVLGDDDIQAALAESEIYSDCANHLMIFGGATYAKKVSQNTQFDLEANYLLHKCLVAGYRDRYTLDSFFSVFPVNLYELSPGIEYWSIDKLEVCFSRYKSLAYRQEKTCSNLNLLLGGAGFMALAAMNLLVESV